MIHWSIKLGRSCSITFHILYLLLCSPHVSYLKKILWQYYNLSSFFCFSRPRTSFIFIGCIIYTSTTQSIFFMMYYSGVGLEPARNTIDGRNVALNFFRKKRLTKHFLNCKNKVPAQVKFFVHSRGWSVCFVVAKITNLRLFFLIHCASSQSAGDWRCPRRCSFCSSRVIDIVIILLL